MWRAFKKRTKKGSRGENYRSFTDPALVIHQELSGPQFQNLSLFISLPDGIDFRSNNNSLDGLPVSSYSGEPSPSTLKRYRSKRVEIKNNFVNKGSPVAFKRQLSFPENDTYKRNKKSFKKPKNYSGRAQCSPNGENLEVEEKGMGVDILRDIIGGKFTDLKDYDDDHAVPPKKSDTSEPGDNGSKITTSNGKNLISYKLQINDGDRIFDKKGINSSESLTNVTPENVFLSSTESPSFLQSYKRLSGADVVISESTKISDFTGSSEQLSRIADGKGHHSHDHSALGSRDSASDLIALMSHLEAAEASKLPLSSSRNTQSAARLNRIINVSFGPSYKNGGSSSTLPHTRTLPCGLPTAGGSASLQRTQDSMHGRGGSLREDLPRHGLVSQQRMDLVYVTERIISLAFPPDLQPSTYTLHLREVAHMLSSKHGDNFRVFNLSWCQGEVSHYLPRVTELGWPPLLAPALEKLCAICKALESWLGANNQHVAVLHDREGYEKLGVVVAAYMHYTNICASTDTALDRYAMKRFFDDKIGQLYHPSQKRYVQYFSGLLSGLIRINSSPLYLHTLTLYGVPHFESRGGCHLFIKVYQGMTHIYTSGVYHITDGLRHVTIVLEHSQLHQQQQQQHRSNNVRVSGLQLRGDVLLKAYHRRMTPQPGREIIFRAQFHTCAVSEKVLGFSRLDLDDACNDLRFPLDGGIELSFSQAGDDPPRAVSNVSCDSSLCPVTAWDSYETLHPRRETTGFQDSVPHTHGPLDGSLYATVNKKRSGSLTGDPGSDSKSSGLTPLQHYQQQQRLQQQHQQLQQQQQQQQQQQPIHNQHIPYGDHSKAPQHIQYTAQQTPHRSQQQSGLQQQYPSHIGGQLSRSTPHTPQHPHNQSPLQYGQHTPHVTNQHLVHHQHHISQHHHHHHTHHQQGLPPHQQQILVQQQQQQQQAPHQQYPGSGHTHSHTLTHPNLSTPSPQSAYVNGRYAASVDSGFASTLTPVSPPTSDCPTSSVSPGSHPAAYTGCQQSGSCSGQNFSQSQAHTTPQQVLRRFSDPNQLNMAPVAAVATRPMQSSGGMSSRVDARQLDELLAGMLLDIENIPDLRPGQTPAPDIDSIRCPDLTWNSSTRGRSTSSRSGPTMSPVNGYGGGSIHCGGSNHDSLLDTSLSLSAADDAPYHTRLDSRPFSYGAVTSSPVMPRRRSPSPNSSPNRRPSREPMINRTGLESPRLVRRLSGSVGAMTGNSNTMDGMNVESHTTNTTTTTHNNNFNSVLGGGGGSNNSRRSPSPSPDPGSRGGTLRRERSQTLTNRIMAGEPSPPTTLTRSHVTRSASRLDDPDTIFAPDTLSRSLSGSSTSAWLAAQQRKLLERREAGRRVERGRQDRVLSELRTRLGQQYNRTNTTSTSASGLSRYGRYGDFEDGYVSDTTLFSDTSRESSPVKNRYGLAPLSISTANTYHHQQQHASNQHYSTLQQKKSGAAYGKSGLSEPSSPTNVASKTATLNFARDRLQRLSQQYANATRSVSRKFSDASYDRERPFVTIKRAIASDKREQHQESALSQLQSAPHGHLGYYPSPPVGGDGLLTTMHQQSGEEVSWHSDVEGGVGVHRPVTPGFPPSTPTTPYLNQGLPPKSPTMQRKEQNLSNNSTSGGGGGAPYRSPSPHNNGHASPAPSLYHGPSRRSSLSSLNDSSAGQDVIHSHPKFVKDISKFWYKPTISRDEAINILKVKAPGTFIVRDSNSFPGAFGLAVKVATPPPNVKASTNGGDPANELVRHFLIEPTARGVRLKGCSNEPVFGSLSALVYQHSITALALPCRLTLPERDPSVTATAAADSYDGSTNGTVVDSNSLLQKGAACTVLYLHFLDTESLTGPQAVKRAVTSLLSSCTIRPTPVHFKVSSAGITLTDNHRTLFFRQHFPVSSISHCGIDPDDRRWQHNSDSGEPLASLRMFGFVAKKGTARNQNQCHVMAELEPEQPATAICNFVTKVMMTSAGRANLV